MRPTRHDKPEAEGSTSSVPTTFQFRQIFCYLGIHKRPHPEKGWTGVEGSKPCDKGFWGVAFAGDHVIPDGRWVCHHSCIRCGE